VANISAFLVFPKKDRIIMVTCASETCPEQIRTELVEVVEEAGIS